MQRLFIFNQWRKNSISAMLRYK